MSVIDPAANPDGLTTEELGAGDEFDSDAWLDQLDDTIADFIEDVVGGDYE